MSTGIRDWVSYWDGAHCIYVNARHAEIHYRDVARAMIALIPGPQARVMDYGCGEALHADAVAAQCAELYLCEAGPNLRARLAERFAQTANIRVIAPERLKTLAPESLDLIVANSVVQYFGRAELADLLAIWRSLLAPAGHLVVADVIPPDTSVLTDIAALLRYATAHGFLFAALLGVARTAASSYRSLRFGLGITRYAEAEFFDLLSTSGYAAVRLPHNIEHNPTRMTFLAKPHIPSSSASAT